jgi:hypothetical protein
MKGIWNALAIAGALTLSSCGSWRGSPKIETGADYESCMQGCGPGGACVRTPDGKAWKCLPPAVPVVPAEAGE